MSTNPDEAHALHQQLVSTVHGSKTSALAMGQLLYALKNEDNFRLAIGDGIETWDDYITQPEIALSRSEANRLLQIYEWFVLNAGWNIYAVAAIPIKNLQYLLPIIKKVDNPIADAELQALMQDAAVLSQKDFRERVADIKYPTEERTYEYMIMKRCKETGTMRKVHDLSSEQIVQGLRDYGL